MDYIYQIILCQLWTQSGIKQSVFFHLDILIIVRKYKTDSHLQINWIQTEKKKKKKGKETTWSYT